MTINRNARNLLAQCTAAAITDLELDGRCWTGDHGAIRVYVSKLGPNAEEIGYIELNSDGSVDPYQMKERGADIRKLLSAFCKLSR